MLRYFKSLSLGRSAWLLLALSGLIVEGIALYFQHGMGLVPCVMCIYERLALLTIILAGFIGALKPRFALFRWGALAVGLFGAIKGLLLAIKHTDYQMNPAPWNQCPIKVDFPATLPLNEWFPNLFEAGGLCSKIQWQMLGYTMPQWLIFMFAVYLAVLVIVLISQFVRVKSSSRLLFR